MPNKYLLSFTLYNKEAFLGIGIGLALIKKLLKTIMEKYLQRAKKTREQSFMSYFQSKKSV